MKAYPETKKALFDLVGDRLFTIRYCDENGVVIRRDCLGLYQTFHSHFPDGFLSDSSGDISENIDKIYAIPEKYREAISSEERLVLKEYEGDYFEVKLDKIVEIDISEGTVLTDIEYF